MKKNVVVFAKEGRFGGWPANHGAWSWGDEIVVAFRDGVFELIPNDHAISHKYEQRTLLGRSLDGGETWTLNDPGFKKIQPRGAGLKADMSDVTDCPGGIDFTNPDFCATFTLSTCGREADSWWYWSGDRGHTWNGPYNVPSLGFPCVMARTDYHVLNRDELLMFLTVGKQNDNGAEGRVICAKLCEGGKRFEFVGLVGEEFYPEGYSIMPSSGIRKNGQIVCLNRVFNLMPDGTKSCLIRQYVSNDNGKTNGLEIESVTSTGPGGNPPALVVMKDGTWALTYGVRETPLRMCVRFSHDEGRTWGEEKVLRDDAGCSDFGYPRMVERADGKLVAFYYYNTDGNKERFIAATIFDQEL